MILLVVLSGWYQSVYLAAGVEEMPSVQVLAMGSARVTPGPPSAHRVSQRQPSFSLGGPGGPLRRKGKVLVTDTVCLRMVVFFIPPLLLGWVRS